MRAVGKVSGEELEKLDEQLSRAVGIVRGPDGGERGDIFVEVDVVPLEF